MLNLCEQQAGSNFVLFNTNNFEITCTSVMGRHEAIMPLFLSITLSSNSLHINRNYAHKFAEIMIVIVKYCACVRSKVDAYCSSKY